MYGYIKQPDGVLKPILLKGIKNIVVSGNSLNIIYFQSGSTPIEVLKVNQSIYQQTGQVAVCNEADPANGKYVLTGGDLVSGDIKISFDPSPVSILDTFTAWMNSILSGKVNATSDKTLNEFAPQLQVGYVFGNVGTIPTALALPITEGQTACDIPAVAENAKVVYIAWDLQVDITPPVSTQVFEIIFDQNAATASFTPLQTGEYKLFQFIAPVQTAIDGSNLPPECQYVNALEQTMPDDTEYSVEIVAGGIKNISICDQSIQARFRTWNAVQDPITKADAGNVKTMQYQVEPSPTPQGVVCPINNDAPAGFDVQSWEYFVDQSSAANTSTDNGVIMLSSQKDLNGLCNNAVVNSFIDASKLPYTDDNLNAAWRMNPEYGVGGYPDKAVGNVPINSVEEWPEFGLQGVSLNCHVVPASNGPLPYFEKATEEFHICNGIPVTLDNIWRLDPTRGAKDGSLMYTDGNQGQQPAPPYWESFSGQAGPAPFEYLYVTENNINFRPVNSINGEAWSNIFLPTERNVMVQAGLLPANASPEGLVEPGMGPGGFGQFNGPSETRGNLRFWWRSYNKDKGVYSPYTIFNPATASETALPPNMTKNTYASGPFGMTDVYAGRITLVPFVLEETYQPFLDAGYTHRAFLVGTCGRVSGMGPIQLSNAFVSGARVVQQASNGVNIAYTNNWATSGGGVAPIYKLDSSNLG